MPVNIPVATRKYSDYTLCPDLAETAAQGAAPTESYGNFGLNNRAPTRRYVRQVAVLIGPGEAMRNWSFCVPVQAGRAEDRVDVGAGLRGLGDGQLPGNGCGGSSPTSPPMA